MCRRITRFTPQDELEERFEIDLVDCQFDKQYNISPNNAIPIIIQENDKLKMINMHWGYYPNNLSYGESYYLPNAKGEFIDKKLIFRIAFKKNRCLIPANGFFLWKDRGNQKQPYLIKRKSSKVMLLAGIFSVSGEEYGFSLVTTRPNNLVEKFHNRMPLIISQKHLRTWLSSNSDVEQLINLISPYPSHRMHAIRVSSEVNSVQNEHPGLIKPILDENGKPIDIEIPIDDQSSLSEFF